MFVEMDKMDGELDVKIKKKKKIKKKERLESMKREMDIVSEGNFYTFLWKIWMYLSYLVSPHNGLFLQDDHEITIEDLEARYSTNITKVRFHSDRI